MEAVQHDVGGVDANVAFKACECMRMRLGALVLQLGKGVFQHSDEVRHIYGHTHPRKPFLARYDGEGDAQLSRYERPTNYNATQRTAILRSFCRD
jgi:hypothetical protein